MSTEEELSVLNEVMEEIEEVDLCLICCSKVTNEDTHHNNHSQLSNNLIVFYLLRKVLQVNDIEFKKNLISCGNPVEWIRLCDKCSELTRQAEGLYQKLNKVERELSCIKKLIWDKARSSINNEADRKLKEATNDLTKGTGQVWKRLRNHHIAATCNLSCVIASEPVINPFIEGDKLANYLITRKVSTTAILPRDYSEQNEKDDELLNSLEETNVLEASSLSPLFPLKIKREVKRELDLEAPPPDYHQNCENLLRGGMLAEHDDEEEMEVDHAHGGDQLMDPLELNNDREGEEEDGDVNWDLDEDDDDNEESEVNEEVEDLKEKVPEKGTPTHNSATKWQTVNQPPSHKTTSTGSETTVIKTQDGKFQCCRCNKIYFSLGGCRRHGRVKHNDVLKNDHRLLGKELICKECGKGFKTGWRLNQHVRFVHEKRFLIKCTLCGTGWASKNALQKHMFVRHPEDPSTKLLVDEEGLGLWKCPVVACSVTFLKKEGIKGHLKNAHGKSEDEVELLELTKGADAGVVLEDPEIRATCHICGKGFGNKYNLKEHEKVHENEGKEKQFFCETCRKGFVDKKGLKVHVERVHLKKVKPRIKRFWCETCGMGFTHSCYLKHHLAIHDGEGKKVHVCDKCGSGFVMQKYLKKHTMTTRCGGGWKNGKGNKKGK